MNIVFLINEHYPSGMAATMRIKLFSEFLVEKNHEVKVLISNQDNGINKRFGKHNNVSYKTMLSDKFPRFLLYMFYPFLAIYQLISSRKNNNKNVLVVYDGVDLFNLQFIIFGKLIGYKVILDVVEDKILSNENMSSITKFHVWISEIILPYLGWVIDGVVAISTTLKKKYQFLFKKIDVELIPCSAANLDFSHNRRNNVGKKIKIAYAGSYGHKDGVEYLIDAFCEISKNNEDILLVLLGGAKRRIPMVPSHSKIPINFSFTEPSSIPSDLEDKVLINNNTNIELVSYLPDDEYWQKLSESDILCMTRIDSTFANSGFPFKLGEYLATGKPVIATDVSDVKYYLTDKQDFVMAKPSDTQSLISALEYLIKRPDKRSEIGRNGYNKCKLYFNPKINGKSLMGLVEKV